MENTMIFQRCCVCRRLVDTFRQFYDGGMCVHCYGAEQGIFLLDEEISLVSENEYKKT